MFITQFRQYSPTQGALIGAQRQAALGLAFTTSSVQAGDSLHFGFKKTANGSTIPYQDAALGALDSYDAREYQPKKLAAITVTIHGQQERYFIYSQNLADLMDDHQNDVHEIYQEKNPHVNGVIFKRKSGGDWHTLQIRDPQDPVVKRRTIDNGAETDPASKTLTLTLAKQ